MPKFFTQRFEKEVVKASQAEAVQRMAYDIAKEKAKEAKDKMVKEFKNHPVTREIMGGANATNLSGTLGGYGNLFSFIGFSTGSDPISPIKNYLENSVRIHRKPIITKSHKDVIMKFRMDVPKTSDIEVLSPSPWEGRSWARGVERSITGFGNYMYSRTKGFENSRSKKAVQTSKKMRSMAFKPVKYISSILDAFNDGLK